MKHRILILVSSFIVLANSGLNAMETVAAKPRSKHNRSRLVTKLPLFKYINYKMIFSRIVVPFMLEELTEGFWDDAADEDDARSMAYEENVRVVINSIRFNRIPAPGIKSKHKVFVNDLFKIEALRPFLKKLVLSITNKRFNRAELMRYLKLLGECVNVERVKELEKGEASEEVEKFLQVLVRAANYVKKGKKGKHIEFSSIPLLGKSLQEYIDMKNFNKLVQVFLNDEEVTREQIVNCFDFTSLLKQDDEAKEPALTNEDCRLLLFMLLDTIENPSATFKVVMEILDESYIKKMRTEDSSEGEEVLGHSNN